LLPRNGGVILCDDDNLASRKLTPEDSGRLQSIHAGHIDVHQHNVGTKQLGLLHGLDAVAGFSTHVPTCLSFDKTTQRPSK
jgi:hypothetical protein